jgi:general secretion pathway protein J
VKRRARGFTLVELVIALALMGLITLLLFSGLRLGSRAWEGVAASTERTAGLRLARNFLERTLVQVREVQIVFDGESRLLFSGESQALEFVSPLGQHVGIGGLYVLRVTLEESGDSQRLILTRWLLHADVLAGTDRVPVWEPLSEGRDLGGGDPDQDLAAGVYGADVLLENVEEFGIAYYGAPDGDQEPAWHETWLEQPTLPIAVYIRLRTTEETWPHKLIALSVSRSFEPEFYRGIGGPSGGSP